MDDMTRIGAMILEHWKTHRPATVREMEQAGTLERTLRQAQEQTGDLLYQLVSVQKMQYREAWELATKEWAFLPEEDPQPSSANRSPNRTSSPPATSG